MSYLWSYDFVDDGPIFILPGQANPPLYAAGGGGGGGGGSGGGGGNFQDIVTGITLSGSVIAICVMVCFPHFFSHIL